LRTVFVNARQSFCAESRHTFSLFFPVRFAISIL
jgi:hypothetical protein